MLTRKGRTIKILAVDREGTVITRFDWYDAAIDSLIYASGFGIGSLVTGIADGGLSILDFEIAALLFLGSFVGFLRVKRSIPKNVDDV